jgi:hypothetical protein
MIYAIRHMPTAEKDNHMCYIYPTLKAEGWMPSIGPKIGFWGTNADAEEYLKLHFPDKRHEYQIEEVRKRVRN